MKWDKWAFVAILVEADMPLDEYFSTKKENDCKFKMRKHCDRPTTCKRIKELVQSVIQVTREDPMLSWDEIEKLVMRMKFQK